MIGNLSSTYQLLIFSLFSVITFVALSLAGAFIFRSDRGTETRNVFMNVLYTLLLLISIYSIIVCKGITINILLFLVLIYLIYENYKHKKPYVKPNLSTVLKLSIIFPIIIFITGYYVFPDNIENDIRFYSKISYCLSAFGQENVHHFYNNEGAEFSGTYPYHYTELWLNSFFADVLQIQNLVALKYITYPFLISLVFVGFASFAHKNAVGIIVSFAISVFPFFVLFNFKNINYYIYSDFWLRPNFIIYYLGILALCIFIFEKNYKQVLITSLIVFTFSITLIPGLLASIIVFWFILRIKKEFTWKQFMSFSLVTCLFLIGMALFYKVTKATVSLVPMTPLSELIREDMKIMKAIVGISVILITEALIIPLLSYLSNRYIFKFVFVNEIVMLIVFSTIGSVLFFQIFNHIDNSYQFPYFSYCFSTVFLIIYLLKILNTFSVRWQMITAACLGLFSLYLLKTYHTVDLKDSGYCLSDINLMREGLNSNEISEIKKRLKPGSRGSYALSENDLDNYSPKRRQSMVLQLGSYLSYVYDNSNQYSVTCKEVLLKDKSESNKVVFEKLDSWLMVYPKYSTNCNLGEQLTQGGFDYLIVSKEFVIPDSLTKDPNKLISSGKYQILILSRNG